jgi:hypothetical protein
MQRHPPFQSDLDRSDLADVREERGLVPLRLGVLADCSMIHETNPGEIVTLARWRLIPWVDTPHTQDIGSSFLSPFLGHMADHICRRDP